MKITNTSVKYKLLVLTLKPNAYMYESQIQFQKTYNIKSENDFLGYGFSKKDAWQKAYNTLVK